MVIVRFMVSDQYKIDGPISFVTLVIGVGLITIMLSIGIN